MQFYAHRLLIIFYLVVSCLCSFNYATALAQTSSVDRQIMAASDSLKAGDLTTAEQTFVQLLRQGVKNAVVFHNLGVIEQRRGRHQQAVTRFQEALLLQPDYAPARLLLGSSLLSLGKKREAVTQLERAVKLLPDEPQAHLQLARAYETNGNLLSAVEQYQQLAQMSPQEAEYAYQLGRLFLKLSVWSYEEMARIDPHAARLQQTLGQEFLFQERYDQAIGAFRQAARLDPQLPEIHLALALIALELKRYDEALTEIELELKLVPQSKAARETKIKIEAARRAAAP
jgi:tetratricopeptide (TPR) repeat protein